MRIACHASIWLQHMDIREREERLTGTLLGTAIGDALGLAVEGMSAHAIARRFGAVDRYHLLGRTGFVSDDTEQSALVAHALVRPSPTAAGAFRRALVGWLFRMPWGIGWGTLRACVRIVLGLAKSGVRSAGNGAAMRAAIVGVFFAENAAARERTGRAIAEVTHVDPRAVAGALYVAEVAAACARTDARLRIDDAVHARMEIAEAARKRITEPTLRAALDEALDLAADHATTAYAARRLGTSGYVVESVAFATYAFVRWGADPFHALREAASAGGDTDTNAAIVGAWCGALYGASRLPRTLVDGLHDGPFGRTHLAALGRALARTGAGLPAEAPTFSPLAALTRNMALFPVVLVHAISSRTL
jgi:ADP-ribosylglycohydrolase